MKKIITFDDGYKTVLTKAYPYLKAKGLTGICFVVTDWIGQEGRLTWDDLKFLQEEGWEIGSHTMTHPDLTKISAAMAEIEIAGSKRALMQHSIIPKAFAYPYNFYTQEVIDIVSKHYEWGRAVLQTDGTKWTIPRSEKVLVFHSIDEPGTRSNVSLEEFKKQCKQMIKI